MDHINFSTYQIMRPFGAAASYALKGVQGWTYPACNSGYTKKSSGKAHPDAYACFSTTPPAPTCEWNNSQPAYIESGIKQFEMQGTMVAYQDWASMKSKRTSLDPLLNSLTRFKPCTSYAEMVRRVTAAYDKSYDSRPPLARAR